MSSSSIPVCILVCVDATNWLFTSVMAKFMRAREVRIDLSEISQRNIFVDSSEGTWFAKAASVVGYLGAN